MVKPPWLDQGWAARAEPAARRQTDQVALVGGAQQLEPTW